MKLFRINNSIIKTIELAAIQTKYNKAEHAMSSNNFSHSQRGGGEKKMKEKNV